LTTHCLRNPTSIPSEGWPMRSSRSIGIKKFRSSDSAATELDKACYGNSS